MRLGVPQRHARRCVLGYLNLLNGAHGLKSVPWGLGPRHRDLVAFRSWVMMSSPISERPGS